MKKALLLLTAFVLLALGVRLWKLNSTPQSLTWDEAALGYNAYSISKTGADEYGTKFPLVLRSYDDYKPALYAYLSLPFISVFGLTITAIRLISALAGASLVLSVYLLAKNIFNSYRLALTAAALVIFSPLLLLYSRIALEANLSLALFVAGLALVLGRSRLSYFAGLALLLLSAYAYHSPRYLVPAIVFFTFILPFNRSIIRSRLPPVTLFSLLYLPIIYFVLNPQYNTRFSQTSLVTNLGIVSASNAPIAGISRLYLYLLDFVGRYLTYFNPYQLFVSASGHELYRLDGWGIFNPLELPFFIIGVYLLIKQPKKYAVIILIWLLASLPAAATVDWFSPLRALLLWPFLILLTALGIDRVLRLRFRFKALVCFLALGLWLFQNGRILESVLAYQPYAHFGAYQYGFAQTVPFVKSVQNQYDRVIIDSPHAQPHLFVLFFSQYDPLRYQQDTAWRKDDHSPRYNFDFGPYVFRKIYWPDDRFIKNTLFVGNLFSLPNDQIAATPNLRLVKDFYTPDGNISFRVVATP